MNQGKTVFSQLMDFLPWYPFDCAVRRYRGDYRIKSFSCHDQLLCMLFGQLSFRDSLRDIVICLQAQQPKLYHMGIRGPVTRSTFADANETRDWRMYAEFAMALIAEARPLYQDHEFHIHLDQIVYALDSTTIDLALSLFPWATFRTTKAAIKLHTLLDVRGSLPVFLNITEGTVHDVTLLDTLPLEPGAIYVMDRGYIDFDRLYRIHGHKATFVIRAKSNLQFRRQYSHAIDKTTGLRCDQTVRLTGFYVAKDYPEPLRRVKYYDQATKRWFVFLSNNFDLDALTIAQLYKQRWQIELFFKWIKQHLKIKGFYGTSQNAVNTQIWIAMCAYVLVAIIKKRLQLDISLYNMLQILSVNLFEKIPLYQLFSPSGYENNEGDTHNQLFLFNL
ncbi:transposase, IS4 family [Candidatus Vecturithrix granuli]|uniref:Transposase, IS4 family n=1 Tax=Vecturithrix granuli TaxID=1499967 RepID=A0A081C498_VECG1|nr:transposase, IS4 family [Candidatus Vecturithrix granuli]